MQNITVELNFQIHFKHNISCFIAAQAQAQAFSKNKDTFTRIRMKCICYSRIGSIMLLYENLFYLVYGCAAVNPTQFNLYPVRGAHQKYFNVR